MYSIGKSRMSNVFFTPSASSSSSSRRFNRDIDLDDEPDGDGSGSIPLLTLARSPSGIVYRVPTEGDIEIFYSPERIAALTRQAYGPLALTVIILVSLFLFTSGVFDSKIEPVDHVPQQGHNASFGSSPPPLALAFAHLSTPANLTAGEDDGPVVHIASIERDDYDVDITAATGPQRQKPETPNRDEEGQMQVHGQQFLSLDRGQEEKPDAQKPDQQPINRRRRRSMRIARRDNSDSDSKDETETKTVDSEPTPAEPSRRPLARPELKDVVPDFYSPASSQYSDKTIPGETTSWDGAPAQPLPRPQIIKVPLSSEQDKKKPKDKAKEEKEEEDAKLSEEEKKKAEEEKKKADIEAKLKKDLELDLEFGPLFRTRPKRVVVVGTQTPRPLFIRPKRVIKIETPLRVKVKVHEK
ncbi:hypothetical protein QBC47DRAFT_402794 [Echria macrotheca]|uniref:Uncharacterized protein n=1 Tax=Echria macrotheca TaxID=438768 RepID=A0AAJ0F8H4_9PEZI|nr:hypothetical protein QBC47DRAFT_402794 [Echria macrotheca]